MAVWLSDAETGQSQNEEWMHDKYHIWQGNPVLGDYQSDVKGGFNGWFIPTRKSSAGISGLEEEGKHTQRKQETF